MTFRPGVSGNPNGRPVGSRSKAAVLLDRVAEDQALSLLKMLLRKARRGDVRAAELVLSRCWQPRKGRAIRFTLPELHTPADLVAAIAAVSAQASEAGLTIEEAKLVCDILTVQAKAIELQELAADVRAIKEKLKL